MNEELERVVQGLFNGAELDTYDKDFIRRLIVAQQKEIEQLRSNLKTYTDEEIEKGIRKR